MTRRISIIGAALSILFAASAMADDHLTVVELFTSQGCSSCPPADALLGELARRPDVLALSEHVDYWDYLGWKDPFATPQNTERQRAYARRLGLSYVYTPQMVLQGDQQTSGADRSTVLTLIAEHAEPQQRAGTRQIAVQAARDVDIDVGQDGTGELVVRLAPAALSEPVDVWLVQFDASHSTKVSAGENGGHQMRNDNVVRGFTRLATWHGEAATLPVPANLRPGARETGGKTVDQGGMAILVQESDGGRILAAARL